MSKIYKLNYVLNNKLEKIYIFSNNKIKVEKNGIFDHENNEVFNNEEWSKIRSEKIPYDIVKCNIYSDDTIQNIKEKMITYLDLNISTSEIYFFANVLKRLNINAMYNQITQNELTELKYDKMCDFLNNIRDSDLDLNKTCNKFISEKKSYIYDDLNDIELDWEKLHKVSLPIGQKIIFKKNYPFNSNPYHNDKEDIILKEESTNLLSTQNKYVLFQFGKISNNNINFCLAGDVINFSKKTFNDEAYLLKIYFSQLYVNDKIKSLENLEKKRDSLIKKESKRLKTNFQKYNDIIDLFHDLEKDKTFLLEYISSGIKKLHFTIHPHNQIKLPLEILFKIINSNEEMPLVKYNPGSRLENIYRLYTGKNYSSNGSKIPQLYVDYNYRKIQINKLSKELSKRKKVGYYIKDTDIYALCEFLENGNIEIKLEMIETLPLEKIVTFLETHINKLLLNKINDFLQQSGYKFTTFKTLYDDNIEINDIIYEININYNEKIDVNKHITCLSSIFNIHKGVMKTSKDEINMTFKRVSSFKQMDSINAFITICRRNNMGLTEITENLQNNFSLDEEQSQKYLQDWQRNIDLTLETYENKTITIESNPGFDVIIKSNLQRDVGKITQGTQIIINNIDNINYIEHIKIYIDSMLKIIFNTKNDKISKMCKGKKIFKEIQQKEDLKNEQEKDILNLQQVSTAVVSDESDDDDDVLDILFGNKEEEDDEEGIEQVGKVLDLGELINDGVKSTVVDEDQQIIGEIPEFSPDDDEDSDDEDSDDEDSDVELEDKQEDDNEESKNTEEIVGDIPEFSDSDDDSPFPDIMGGALDIELEGLPLSGSKSIFREKREKLEPDLFLKRDQGKFKAYSKSCPWQYKKQPIMLTKEEKDYIDKKDKDSNTSSYDEHITYGTGKDKYHYICPRFWCIRDDNNRSRSLTIDQVNKGECGGWDAVIPEGAKKVPKGKRIFEFTDKLFHRSKSKTKNPLVYKQLYPGFMDKDKHPDGLCVPCCYEKPFTCKVPDDWKEIKVKGEIRYVKKDWIYKEGTSKPINKDKTRGDKPLTKDVQEGWYDKNDNEFKKRLMPQKDCPTGIVLKDMYAPGGPNDEGPSFNKNSDGTIDLEGVKDGKIQHRPIPKKGAEERYKSCNQNEMVSKNSDSESEPEVQERKVKKQKRKKYLTDKAPLLESFPLQQQQTGYLPITLQKFLGYNSREICQKGQDLKNDKYCLLRYGINQHTTQSFLSCIAYIYNDNYTISDLKSEIVKNLTLDKFISVYNGILVTIFYKEKEVDIKKYNYSNIVKSIKEEAYLKKIISAYENFLDYLMDENIKINYEYLWDFICQPKNKNGLLFDKGINMLIFNSPSDDISDKIEIICPKIDYSTKIFDKSVDTIILYSKNNYFEPICQVKKIYGEKKRIKTKTFVNKFFTMNNIKENTPEILNILMNIVDDNLSQCLGEQSISKKKYSFDRNKSSHELIETIVSLNYKVDNQILNGNNQVIALIISKLGKKLYLPSLPSSLNQEYSFIYSKSPNIYFDYKDTYNGLLELSKHKIPCKPVFKLVSDEMVVGLVTKTNQFVPVEPIIQTDIDDGLKIIKSESILDVNNKIIDNESIDEERVITVKKIKLETNFYNMFRNSFKHFLTNKKNRDKKINIMETINDFKITYLEKLRLISEYIKNIMENKVEFIEYKLNTLKSINQLFKCFDIDRKSCNERSNCSFNEKGNCALLLPKKNLLNEGDNSYNYFLRLSDELIRFINIRKYIFTPRTFLSFENINYNLTNEEIILLEDVLLNKYFEDLIALELNEYVSNSQIFETANPIEHIPIKTIFNIQKNKKNANVCTYEPQIPLKIMNWTSKLNLTGHEISHYKQSAFCSFQLLLDIINNNLKSKGKKEIDIITLKKELYQEIVDIKNTQSEEILNDIFKVSSAIKIKKSTSNVLNNNSQLETHISSANYFVTEIDMYILFKKYKINAVLITNKYSSKLPVSNNNYLSFIQDEKPIYIIICNGMQTRPNKNFPDKAIESSFGYPRYGMFYLNNNNLIEQKYMKEFVEYVGNLIPIEIFFSDFKTNNDTKKEEERKKGRDRIQKYRKIKKLKKIKLGTEKKGGVKKLKRIYEMP
jgi:hypothetical protein